MSAGRAPGKLKSKNSKDQAQILAWRERIDRIASMVEKEVAVQSVFIGGS
ncbi:hypothetical protein X747_32920 [Mesorhizobium sp. LNJC384A00]|nr:hypothetical protein X747_32920 [Mesorhizobium sp. LNJC384A00]